MQDPRYIKSDLKTKLLNPEKENYGELLFTIINQPLYHFRVIVGEE